MPTLNDYFPATVFQNGHFLGYAKINLSNNKPEYHDAPYGSTTGVVGPQTYAAEKFDGNGNWRIKINGAIALTTGNAQCRSAGFPVSNYYANGGRRVKVVIESADSDAVFTSPTSASGWTTR